MSHDPSATTDSRTTFESFGLSGSSCRNECADLVGQTIDGRYTLESRLGEGGFGCVFLARQKSPNRPVAVKVQKHAGRESHRMAKEADLLARLDDRGIARVFEAGSWASPSGSRIFVAMELIPGGKPLHHFCAEKRLSVTERLALFREVCRAVSIAHREGIIHRDLKPGNILVDRHGQPRVIDFGISKLAASEHDPPDGSRRMSADVGTDHTRAGAFLGTPTYAALEQQSGEATTRSDVHALGVILKKDLFADLEGRMPKWLGPLVARCTASDPESRPADAAHLAAAIDRVRRRRRSVPFAAVAAMLLIGGIGMGSVVKVLKRERVAAPPKTPETLAVTLIDDCRAAAGDPAAGRLATATGPEVVVSATGAWTWPEHHLDVAAAGPLGIAFGDAGSIVAISDAAALKAWDLPKRSVDSKPIFELRADASSQAHDHLIAVSPDGNTIFSQDGPRSLVAYATHTETPLGRAEVGAIDSATRITSVAPAAVADAALVGLSDGSVRRWSLTSGSTSPIGIDHGVGAVLLAANVEGTSIASCGSDGRVVFLDGRTSEVRNTATLASGTFTAICLVEGDDVVVATRPPASGGASVLRLSRGDHGTLVVSASSAVARPVTALAFTGTEILAVAHNSADRATDRPPAAAVAGATTLTAAAPGPSPD